MRTRNHYNRLAQLEARRPITPTLTDAERIQRIMELTEKVAREGVTIYNSDSRYRLGRIADLLEGAAQRAPRPEFFAVAIGKIRAALAGNPYPVS